MKSITIIGAGEAGLYLLKLLRQKNKDTKIQLIDKRTYYFDKSEFLSKLTVNSKIDLVDFSKELEISFINDEVIKINPQRRKIYLKEKGSIDFENLVIATGLTSRKLSIKGDSKEGFFYLSEIEPVAILSLLRISNEVTVYASTVLGLKLAVTLAKKGKETNLVVEQIDFISDYKEKILESCAQKNIKVYLNSKVEEAIGESTIRAIKISPLKVFSSQMLFVDSNFVPNIDFFETDIKIKDNFSCDFEGIFFLGDIKDGNQNFYVYNKENVKKEVEAFLDFIFEGKMPVIQKKDITSEDKEKLFLEMFTL